MVPAAIFLHNLRLREHRLHAIPLKGVPYLTSRTILSNNQILTLSWQFIVELCVFRRSEPVDDMWLWGQRVFLWRVVVETHEMDGRIDRLAQIDGKQTMTVGALPVTNMDKLCSHGLCCHIHPSVLRLIENRW